MIVQAEVSLYPLRTPSLGEPIASFLERLESAGLEIEAGPMSSTVVGESGEVFAALADAFGHVARDCHVVLSAKVSNACPMPSPQPGPGVP